ncbi:hypothetical protein BDFG_07984 [Blastomyces dermatitidis ATCC 26199]|nr:hypothetical protein BDFG_07984 [Blastomyces dermatitidis ATCC 26199]
MSTRTTRTQQNDSIDQGTTMAERAEQQSSFDSWENISLSSTDSMRPTSPIDDFDCAVILADARTLFSYIALLKLMIKIQQTEPQSKKRTMQPAGDAGQGNCGKRRRRH